MDTCGINYLTADTAYFFADENGTLQLKMKSGVLYPNVRVFRSYPLKQKNLFISVRDGINEDVPEIGIIRDLNEFPPDTRKLIDEKLDQRYFVPVINKIIFLEEEGDHLNWEVDTDKGIKKFMLRNSYDNIHNLTKGRFLIIDTNSCRYEIQDSSIITGKAKGILSRHIYL